MEMNENQWIFNSFDQLVEDDMSQVCDRSDHGRSVRSLRMPCAPDTCWKCSQCCPCRFPWPQELPNSIFRKFTKTSHIQYIIQWFPIYCCEVDCEWGQWGACVATSNDCGPGTRTRTKTQEKNVTGTCDGESSEACETGIACVCCVASGDRSQAIRVNAEQLRIR